MATEKIKGLICPTCGSDKAYEILAYSEVGRPTGYFGERPEEYGQTPDTPQVYRVERYEVREIRCRTCIGKVIRQYAAFHNDIRALVKGDPVLLTELTPEQFEGVIRGCFEQAGYNVTPAGPVNAPDGGIDFIACPKQAGIGAIAIAVQVKHHKDGRNTGVDAVDRMMAWNHDVFQLGFIVTNTRFTSDATFKASKPNARGFIRLRDVEDLLRWLDNDFESVAEIREMPTQIQLTAGLIVPIQLPSISVPFAIAAAVERRLVSSEQRWH